MMTVFDLCDNQKKWENEHSGFRISGSKIVWESAVYARRVDKVIITRVVNPPKGKPLGYFGLNYISRYVNKNTLVTHLMKRYK